MKVPISTVHLFPQLQQLLLELLTDLSPTDWEKRTIVPLWTIKDIAAHLLDGNLRTLSMARDQYFGKKPGLIESYGDLMTFLNHLNASFLFLQM